MNPPTPQKVFNVLLLCLLFLQHFPCFGQGDTLVSFWQGSYVPKVLVPNISVTNMTEGPGITAYDCSDNYVAAAGFDQNCAPEGLANGDYWEFTITPATGHEIIFDWFEVQQRASFHDFSEVNTLGTVYWKIGNGDWIHSQITARVDPKTASNFCTSFASRRPHYPSFSTDQAITFRMVRFIYDNDQYGFSRVNRNGYTWVSGIISAVLPVELTNFEAIPKGKSVLLKWATKSETNNQGFEVQHSIDGQDWTILGFVAGNGTSSETHQYTFTDNRPQYGYNYYRLKQIDFDQDFDYSEIEEVSMRNDQKELTHLYPNPSNGHFTVQLSNPAREGAIVTLITSTGEVLWSNQFGRGEMESLWRKAFHLGQEGLYFLHSQIGKATEVKKVVIIHQN